MTPLGWCWAQTTPPEAVTLHPLGAIALATATAPTARDRLRHLITLCSAGIDILPLAPSRTLSVTAARSVDVSAVETAHAGLAGHVQMNLLVTPPDTRHQPHGPSPDPTTGQAWLQERRSRNAIQSEWCARVTALASALSPRCTPATWHRSHIQCALLVPRSKVPALGKRLQSMGMLGADVLITGPWPPLAFVGPLDRKQAA